MLNELLLLFFFVFFYFDCGGWRGVFGQMRIAAWGV